MAVEALAAPNLAPIDPHWRLVGPFRGGWGEMVVGVPERPDEFLFGAAGGGVWRSDNAGRTWTSLFDHGPTAPIGALAVAPSNPDVIYIGSGQPEPRYDVQSGAGVFASRDGGKSWASLGLEKTLYTGRVWVDPRDANTVLVAAVGDFFASGGERGVYRSIDGGKTWSHPLDAGPDTGAVDIVADPANPNTLFAATWQARQYPWQSYFTEVAGPGSAVWRSDDGGATWRKLGGAGWPAGSLGRISVAATRTASGLRVYAVVSAKERGGLYRSDDGGASWTRVNDEQAFTSYYASRVTVDPTDPDVVWLVGQSVRRCDQGGARCTIFKGAPGGDDYHFVWVNPKHPDHMATASDQGVVVSVDGGRSWSSWYNQPTAQFYHLATDDRFPYRVYSGQQDSGTVSILSRSDYGAIGWRDWNPVGGEERDFDIPDPRDPDIVFASGLGGKITRWDAHTGQVADVAPFLEPNYGRRQTQTAHHFVWVTPMAISKVGEPVLYLGGEVVFASRDRGASWTVVSPDLTGKQAGAERCGGDPAIADARACGYGGIWSLAPSPRVEGELWVGTDSGLVQLTRDGGVHWDNVTPPGVPAWAKIASIDPSPLADGTAVIAVDGQRLGDRAPHAYETSDYGKSWREITGDLPTGHFVSVVKADPERPGLLFAGTDVGVFASWDDGGQWRPIQGNLPAAWVRDLAVKGDDLIAGTQGRSIWILGDLAQLRQGDQIKSGETAHLFTPASAVRVRSNMNRDTPIPPDEARGENPPEGAVIDYWLARDAKGPVALEIRDASGALVQRLTSAPARLPPAERYFAKGWLTPNAPLAAGAGLHRAVWNLRWSRPAAVTGDFGINAVYGRGTPVTPEGPLALPGAYTVTLVADGKRWSAPITVTQDPRSRADAAALAASLDLSHRISEALAIARRGFGEMEYAGAEAGRRAASTTGDLGDRLKAFGVEAKVPEGGNGFRENAGVLAGIETDLEGSDLAPTAPQMETVAAGRARIDALWAAWSARKAELEAINAALAKSRAKPIVLPPPEDLVISAPEGGEDLP